MLSPKNAEDNMIVISFVYSAHTKDSWLCGDAGVFYYLNTDQKTCLVTVCTKIMFDISLINTLFNSDKKWPG